jgi:hypothetical protein
MRPRGLTGRRPALRRAGVVFVMAFALLWLTARWWVPEGGPRVRREVDASAEWVGVADGGRTAVLREVHGGPGGLRTVRLLDVESGADVARLGGPDGGVGEVRIAADGAVFAVNGVHAENREVKQALVRFDRAAGARVIYRAHLLNGALNFTLAPDGRTVAVNDQDDNGIFRLRVLDAVTGRVLLHDKESDLFRNRVTFSGDGGTLVVEHTDERRPNDVVELRLWDVRQGRQRPLRRRLPMPALHGTEFELIVSPGGRWVAWVMVKEGVGDERQAAAVLWDLTTGAERPVPDLAKGREVHLQFADENTLVLATGSRHAHPDTLRLIDPATGRDRTWFALSPVHQWKASPDGRLLCFAPKQPARPHAAYDIVDATTGRKVCEIPEHEGSQWTPQFCRDGRTLLGWTIADPWLDQVKDWLRMRVGLAVNAAPDLHEVVIAYEAATGRPRRPPPAGLTSRAGQSSYFFPDGDPFTPDGRHAVRLVSRDPPEGPETVTLEAWDLSPPAPLLLITALATVPAAIVAWVAWRRGMQETAPGVQS